MADLALKFVELLRYRRGSNPQLIGSRQNAARSGDRKKDKQPARIHLHVKRF